MVSASAKRQAVKRVVEEGVCSERRACRYLGLHRSSCQYRAQEALEETRKLVKRMVWLSRKDPRYALPEDPSLADAGRMESRTQVCAAHPKT